MQRRPAIPDVSDLTLDEKIGQMLCFGWGGPDSLLAVNEQAREAVRDLKAGGMIVMGRNVQPQTRPLPPIDAAGVRAMLDELQSLADIPLLVPTDQEGGRVARFGSAPFTRMPSAKTIGDRGDAGLARAAARATARELAAVGVNWDFAPDADVNSNPDNPVIGDRAFGSTPGAVTPMVTAQVAGYGEGGVLSCAKHFPGHGDTRDDSHFALPSLPFDLAAMEARELAPFRAAIATGVPTIMTAHILFPGVEPSGLPATMSHAILTGLLRERMGFRGLIVTDCLEMKAVADRWGTARAAVLAAKAGADMLLVCHTLERQRETVQALREAVRTGELPEERVTEAAGRVLAVKRQVAEFGPRPDLTVIGAPEHESVRRALSGEDDATAAPTTLGAEAPV
jgi:beta-N-acetylhexosaminidase